MPSLTSRQWKILEFIRENGKDFNWVPIEASDIDESPLGEIIEDARKLEAMELIEMSYPTTSLFVIRNGQRIPAEETSRLTCAIEVEGIKTLGKKGS